MSLKLLLEYSSNFSPRSVAQPGILLGRGQSMTSSVTDAFLPVQKWYRAPVKILASSFRGSMASSAPFWLQHCPRWVSARNRSANF